MNSDNTSFPFTQHWFQLSSGHRMHFVDEGPREGLTIMMLHGNPTWSFFYRDMVMGLAPHVRCIAPDHLGCGYSDKPQVYPYTLEQHITNVRELLEHLGLESVILMVHDWGGAIGMGLAQHLGKKLKGIVLFNTAAFVSQHIPKRIAICRLPKIGTWINRGLNGFARAAITMAMPKGKRLPKKVAQFFLSPYSSWQNRVAIDAFIKDIPMEQNHPSRKILEGIEKSLNQHLHLPRIIFWGEQDFCFNQHFLDRWKRIWPDAEVHLLPEAGHYLLETHSDEILSRLHSWLHDLDTP